jgi:hypothetical protein
MEQTEFPETLAFKLQTPGNNPEESIRHSKNDESLKSREMFIFFTQKTAILPTAVRRRKTLAFLSTYVTNCEHAVSAKL